jgi:hypothetical protein
LANQNPRLKVAGDIKINKNEVHHRVHYLLKQLQVLGVINSNNTLPIFRQLFV